MQTNKARIISMSVFNKHIMTLWWSKKWWENSFISLYVNL